ncbi:coiled-coil domain-containing protein 171-like isoform X3 [Phyllopteryx taeniolatus]|uniref:coiled-coil domain-containing protein 171-like isoform X3 n=1 Tax=Phyllopteryx taeniolatus TaxID=161469 RepID=UPI002AD48E42|nr:coiled-coil domain-containing protein 171-like isoform X3 [Phyllopteryx taeniolatus]
MASDSNGLGSISAAVCRLPWQPNSIPRAEVPLCRRDSKSVVPPLSPLAVTKQRTFGKLLVQGVAADIRGATMQDQAKDQRGAPPQAVPRATTMLNAGTTPSSTELGTPQQPRGHTGNAERGRGEQVDSKLTGRRRIQRLEKEKLEMTSTHNQQLCALDAELARLRSSVERGEAQRAELQYRVAVGRRDAQRACESNEALAEQSAALQKVLDMTRQARQEERLALQQEVDERDALVEGLTSESERLHRLLLHQEEALEEVQRRMVGLQKERDKEVQGRKSLEANVEAERAAHLEFKHKCEVAQAALAQERRGQREAQYNLELLRGALGDVERAYQEERESRQGTEKALQRLQTEYEQYKCDVSVALETEKRNTAELAEKLEEEKRQHGNTHLLVEQNRQVHCGKLLEEIREALQQRTHKGAKDDGKRSLPADVMQLLHLRLSGQEVAEQQVQDLLLACERLDEEKQTLKRLTAHQERRLQEVRQLSLKLQERVSRLQEESRDWAVHNEKLQDESKTHLSFLHCISQRLLAGSVLAGPQITPGTLSRSDLCDLISELVEQLTSDLQEANNKVARLQAACEEKSGRVRQLQGHHKLVLAHAREGRRRRAEAWNSRHARTVTQLRDLLSLSRRKSASFLSACALLAGTTAHAQRRLRSLAEQKHLLASRSAAREDLEEELRRLADALGGDEGGRSEGGGRSPARRRWGKYVCVVSALRRWRAVGRRSTELFRLETGGAGVVVCVATATLMGEDVVEGRDALCARWLRSKRLRSAILDCMADLPPPGSSPPRVRSAARSGLARLLDQIVGQSESAPEILHEMIPQTPPPDDSKALVSRLRHHFLLLSQRLHSAEVERRSLRLQVANLRRTESRGEDPRKTVPAKHFHSVCTNLRQALSGEQEARAMLREQSTQRDSLQLRLDAYAAERARAHRALGRTAEALAEARRRLTGKERSLRILGKHLSRVDKERRRLRHVEDANRRQERLIGNGEAAEEVAIGPASGALKGAARK